MASNRDLWLESFDRNNIPALPCPSCRVGRLALDDETYSWRRLGTSDQFHSKFGYTPEEDYGRFVCQLVCSNGYCREVISVAGDTEELLTAVSDDGNRYDTILYPKIMLPGPPLMDIPEGTPVLAVEAIKQAFNAFWGDRGSAANRLRISVERIMDAHGIPKQDGGKDLKLFRRIELFGEQNADSKDMLDALRHVGNLGSHDGDVSREALLDAFEIYQEWLRNFYGKYPNRMRALTERLIATKGRYG